MHSETDTDRTVTRRDATPLISPSATPQEAAAIAAALQAHLEMVDDDDEGDVMTWNGKRFQFAGRIAAVTGTPRRVPCGAPTDEWTAVGRSDRFQR